MGQKLAAYDSAGAIFAFYDVTDSPAPEGVSTIEITDAQYQACLGVPSHMYAVAEGALVAVPPPPLTLAQQASAALSVGCAIVSTGSPALDGTYACDAVAQARLTAIQTRINAGLGLPLGLSTIDWVDTTGAAHSFTGDQFTALAHAISDYVYQLDMLVLGQGSALPAQPVTIA